MSKMAEIDLEIRDMLDEGLSPLRISSLLEIPMEMVYDIYLADKKWSERFNITK